MKEIKLALFTYNGDDGRYGDITYVSMQCEIEGYTRVSEWKYVPFKMINDKTDEYKETWE